ncbi:MAG: hypothetical protein R3192_09160 [Woeseiaceae bacterium]|nr:hypothetical protein [Woeseiaceae bacterium]
MSGKRILTCAEVGQATLHRLAADYGIDVNWVDDDKPIDGSFWGEPEAGIVGTTVSIRADTPLHSLLHELCHLVCMSPERRNMLHGNAGSDDLEEAAVCYLQVVLADELEGVGRARLMQDMDAWGYSFRLGATRRWFDEDAQDARDWLLEEGLMNADGAPVFRLRGQ